MSESIISEIKGKIANLSINRPQVKNALNLDCILELTSEIKKLDAEKSVKCLIISGYGREVFCSGADLKEFSEKNSLKEKTDYFNALAGLITAVRAFSRPVISKVYGYAMAGGLSLVAASDIVLASNDSKFGLPELKVGMIPGVVMLALKDILSKRALDYLSLTANIIDAEESLRIGLISAVYDKNILDKKTLETAEQISSFSNNALVTVKKMLNSGNNFSGNDLSEKLCLRTAEMANYSLTKDCIEGIDAFINKRKAKWHE